MYVCSCFGITESQVKQHAAEGACTPRQIASQCRAGTDCGGCVRRIQSLLGRGECPSRRLVDGRTDMVSEAAEQAGAESAPAVAEPVHAVSAASPGGPFAAAEAVAPAEVLSPTHEIAPALLAAEAGTRLRAA